MSKKFYNFVMMFVGGWCIGLICGEIKNEKPNEAINSHVIYVELGAITTTGQDTTVFISVDDKRINTGYKVIKFYTVAK